MSNNIGRLALVTFVAGLFAALYAFDFFELLQNPEAVRDAFLRLGVWGPILYFMSFSLLEPFFVPGLAFIVPGSFVWSFPTLFLLSWLGSVGAGVVGFSFARYLGRDFVEGRLPERLRVYDERLAERGLRTVILVRLTLFLAPPTHWLLGVSKVSFGSFLLGTMIGYVPGILALTYVVSVLESSMTECFASFPPEVWIAAAVLVLALVVHRRRSARRAARA